MPAVPAGALRGGCRGASTAGVGVCPTRPCGHPRFSRELDSGLAVMGVRELVTVAEVASLRTWYGILCHRIPRMHFHVSLHEGTHGHIRSGWCQDGALDRGTRLPAPRDLCQPDPAGSGVVSCYTHCCPPPPPAPILHSAHSTHGPQSQPWLCGPPGLPCQSSTGTGSGWRPWSPLGL